MLRSFVVAALVTTAVGCGARTPVDGAGGSSSASSTSTTSSGAGTIPCGPVSCAADEYCFHSWTCGGVAGTTCSATCPCACGSLPDACPATSPCDCPAGGYYGSPGVTFTPDEASTLYPDHQVACYGS